MNGYLLTVAKGSADEKPTDVGNIFASEDTGFASRGRSGETLLRYRRQTTHLAEKQPIPRG